MAKESQLVFESFVATSQLINTGKVTQFETDDFPGEIGQMTEVNEDELDEFLDCVEF